MSTTTTDRKCQLNLLTKTLASLPGFSARPGANGKSIKIIDPASGKTVGYYITNDSVRIRRYDFDIKKTYNKDYITHLRNEYKIFDMPLARLTRAVREIGEYAIRCARISDDTDVLQKERRKTSALLKNVLRFKEELRGWPREDVAGVMACAARISVGAVRTDVPLGRGDAYYQELFRLLNAAEDGFKLIQTPSVISTDRLKVIMEIKRKFCRQSERMASVMAYIPSPASPSRDHFSHPTDHQHLQGDPYDQLLRVVESLEAVLALVIRQGKSRSSGGLRIDWGLEALTRRAFDFWEMLGRKVTIDHNQNCTSEMVWFVHKLAVPIQITSDPRKINSTLLAERALRKEMEDTCS